MTLWRYNIILLPGLCYANSITILLYTYIAFPFPFQISFQHCKHEATEYFIILLCFNIIVSIQISIKFACSQCNLSQYPISNGVKHYAYQNLMIAYWIVHLRSGLIRYFNICRWQHAHYDIGHMDRPFLPVFDIFIAPLHIILNYRGAIKTWMVWQYHISCKGGLCQYRVYV